MPERSHGDGNVGEPGRRVSGLRLVVVAAVVGALTSACVPDIGPFGLVSGVAGEAARAAADAADTGRGTNNFGWAGPNFGDDDLPDFHAGALLLTGTFVFDGEQYGLVWYTSYPLLSGTRLTRETLPGGVVKETGVVDHVYGSGPGDLVHAGTKAPATMHLSPILGDLGTYSVTYATVPDDFVNVDDLSVLSWNVTFRAPAEVCRYLSVPPVWVSPYPWCSTRTVELSISNVTNGIGVIYPHPRGVYTQDDVSP